MGWKLRCSRGSAIARISPPGRERERRTDHRDRGSERLGEVAFQISGSEDICQGERTGDGTRELLVYGVLTQDDDRGGSIAHFLILGSGQLDHALRSGVRDIHLSENAVAIIGHNDATLHDKIAN